MTGRSQLLGASVSETDEQRRIDMLRALQIKTSKIKLKRYKNERDNRRDVIPKESASVF